MAKHGHGGGNQGPGGQPTRHPGSAGLSRGTNLIQRAIHFAYRQIGEPYVWGGTGPSGWDCSGLVYAAYRNAGYSGIGRTTYDQIKQGHPIFSASQLRPGDIVFPSAHHEGLYVGHGMILEAPHTGDHVKLIPLSSFGFWQARRLLAGGGGVIPPRAIGGVSRNGLPVPHPSVNPQLFQQWMQSMSRQQAQMMKQFQQQQVQQAAHFQKLQLQSAAQNRQANLAMQLQQQQADRQNAALGAQRTLNGGLSGNASAGSVADLAYQNQQKNADLRQQALKRAGIS
jgi:hypothetical protein